MATSRLLIGGSFIISETPASSTTSGLGMHFRGGFFAAGSNRSSDTIEIGVDFDTSTPGTQKTARDALLAQIRRDDQDYQLQIDGATDAHAFLTSTGAYVSVTADLQMIGGDNSAIGILTITGEAAIPGQGTSGLDPDGLQGSIEIRGRADDTGRNSYLLTGTFAGFGTGSDAARARAMAWKDNIEDGDKRPPWLTKNDRIVDWDILAQDADHEATIEILLERLPAGITAHVDVDNHSALAKADIAVEVRNRVLRGSPSSTGGADATIRGSLVFRIEKNTAFEGSDAVPTITTGEVRTIIGEMILAALDQHPTLVEIEPRQISSDNTNAIWTFSVRCTTDDDSIYEWTEEWTEEIVTPRAYVPRGRGRKEVYTGPEDRTTSLTFTTRVKEGASGLPNMDVRSGPEWFRDVNRIRFTPVRHIGDDGTEIIHKETSGEVLWTFAKQEEAAAEEEADRLAITPGPVG